MVIIDEILAGLGLGPGGVQYFDVMPDVAVFAKAMVAFSRALGKQEIIDLIGIEPLNTRAMNATRTAVTLH